MENIDLSAISAPEEVCVYSAALWEMEPEEVADIFLGSDFKEGETYAEGRSFVKSAGTKKEERVNVCDGGMAYFGERGHAADNGVIFSGRADYQKICQKSDGFEEMENEYLCTGKISGRELGEQEDIFLAAKETVSKYLEKLGMDGYVLDAAAPLITKNQKDKKSYWMCWKQLVDGIPISDSLLENTSNKTVYNYRYSISSLDLLAVDSSLNVMFMGKELVCWDNYCIIYKDRQLGKYSVIPAREAYKKVQERYPQGTEDGELGLERAELQYELVKLEGKYYLYPVWVFGIYGKDREDGEKKWTII